MPSIPTETEKPRSALSKRSSTISVCARTVRHRLTREKAKSPLCAYGSRHLCRRSCVAPVSELHHDTGITLPTGEADTPVVTADSQLLTAQSVADVDITTDNVQHVIASLTRPEAYSCTIENKLYYTGGSSALRCRRYVRDGVIRTDTLTESGAVRSSQRRYHLFLER